MSSDPTEAELIGSSMRALGLAAEPALVETLQAYLGLLQRWNATYNLTAVRSRKDMLTQHLADCLAVVPKVERRLKKGSVLDVGSGGGFPGVILAAAMVDLKVTCVDAVGKKAAFVRQVAGALNLTNLCSAHSRVEELHIEPVDLIASRAFATLLTFVALTEKHLAATGVWMAMKGMVPHDEIGQLPESIEVFHVEQLNIPGLQAERCLVWMRRNES